MTGRSSLTRAIIIRQIARVRPAPPAGASKVLPVDTLRWVSFGHIEADEAGSMNDWLAIAPQATVAQSEIGCMVSIGDLADRPPRPLADGEKLDIGGHIVQWFDTPHVPHAWEAGVLYDTTTKTLFCGDLFTRFGDYEASTSDDIFGPAVQAEDDAPGRCHCTHRAAPPSSASRPSTSTPWPSCTALPSQATAVARCSTSPPTSTAAPATCADRHHSRSDRLGCRLDGTKTTRIAIFSAFSARAMSRHMIRARR